MLRGADRGGGGRANHPGGGGSGIGGIDGIGGSGGGGGGGGGASVSEELPLRVLDPRMAQALEGMGFLITEEQVFELMRQMDENFDGRISYN